MNAFDKLEIILKREIAKRQKEIDRAHSSEIKPSCVFLYGIKHEKIGLEIALWQQRAIKSNAPSVSVDIVQKQYGPQK